MACWREMAGGVCLTGEKGEKAVFWLGGGLRSWEGEGRESLSESESEFGFGFGSGAGEGWCCVAAGGMLGLYLAARGGRGGGGVKDRGRGDGRGDEEMRIGCSNEVGRVWLFCRGLRARRVGGLPGGLAEACGRGVWVEGKRLDFFRRGGGLAWLAREKGLMEDAGAGVGSVIFSLVLRLVGVLDARI